MLVQVRAGVRTSALDAVAAQIFREEGARSAPKITYGFPGEILISVNDEVVHGIPSDHMVSAGDIVKIDVTAELDGYIADAARTVCVSPSGRINERPRRAARRALHKGQRQARPGKLVSEIGHAVEKSVRSDGLTVIRDLFGHGTGRQIHEPPEVYNFFSPSQRDKLTDGLVITIEPIITSGGGHVQEASDGWTVKTTDGAPAAHWENTIIVRGRGAEILTAT